MKNLAIFGVLAAVLGLGLSAMAADNNAPELYAVSQLSTGSNLQTMTDSQLTSVEGMSWRGHTKDCGGCGKNYWSTIKQANDLYQMNVNMYTKLGTYSGINQENNAYQSNNVGAGVPRLK